VLTKHTHGHSARLIGLRLYPRHQRQVTARFSKLLSMLDLEFTLIAREKVSVPEGRGNCTNVQISYEILASNGDKRRFQTAVSICNAGVARLRDLGLCWSSV
jgi:hypothetical protein